MRKFATATVVVILAGLLAGCPPQGDTARLQFEAESPEFDEATMQYRALWEEDAPRIVAAMERRTGLDFEKGPVGVIVYEGVSFSGYKDTPMRMRASYPLETKRGTLVHELSHRITADLFRKDE